jgi:hypothetical protein
MLPNKYSSVIIHGKNFCASLYRLSSQAQAAVAAHTFLRHCHKRCPCCGETTFIMIELHIIGEERGHLVYITGIIGLPEKAVQMKDCFGEYLYVCWLPVRPNNKDIVMAIDLKGTKVYFIVSRIYGE